MTTKNKIEYKEFFKQILSNLKEILLQRVRALRTTHENMKKKMKQNETEKKMGIIKIELDRKSQFAKQAKIQHTHNWCLKTNRKSEVEITFFQRSKRRKYS